MNLLGVGALGVVAIEWLALGWLSGVEWPREQPVFWAPRWALRLLVGCFLVALAQLTLASIGLGIASIPGVLATAAIAAVVLRVVHARSRCSPKPLPMDRRERAGWLLLGGVLLAATVRALVVPEAGWDAFSHWGLRAQAFALAGTIANAHSEHEYYPPLVPLLEAWVYVHRGGVAIDLAKTIWALVGSAFAVCLAWHLRLNLGQPRGLAPLFGTAIVLATPTLVEGFWTGQADLALTAFLTLATLAIGQWQRSPSRTWLIQASLFGAAAALTKFEGLPRVGVVVAAVLVEGALVRQWRSIQPALWLAAAGGLATLAWTAFELTHGISPNAEHIGEFQPLALGSVLVALAAVFGGVRTGGGILVAAVAWVTVGRKLFCTPLRLLTLVVLGQLVATLGAFLLSSTSPDIEVRTSATRLVAQFLPLALSVSAVGLCGQTRTYNRREQ
ncbi:MAG: hypothetical protein LC797_13780 [Chloroflexi bacterium]|nr:hypothetical protein [Chloroflexota bacterium]